MAKFIILTNALDDQAVMINVDRIDYITRPWDEESDNAAYTEVHVSSRIFCVKQGRDEIFEKMEELAKVWNCTDLPDGVRGWC